MRLEELQAAVARRYRRLDLPAWPDPHPGMDSPPQEAYSRLTAPDRYRVVHARARVWADALSAVAGVKAETFAPDAVEIQGSVRRVDGGVRLISSRPGTLPLLLLEQDTPLREQKGSLPVLHISVVRPELVLESLPDCGCDACDLGSDVLLEEIDETVGQVVGGPYVVLSGEGWQAHWHPGGGGSTGPARRAPDHARLMEMCRRLAAGEKVRLPKGADAYVGQSWLT